MTSGLQTLREPELLRSVERPRASRYLQVWRVLAMLAREELRRARRRLGLRRFLVQGYTDF